MGRYYSGDIEGKFWFAVQSSNDASFFGGEEGSPNYINYYFDESHLESIEAGLKACHRALGAHEAQLDVFFATHRSYNDQELAEFLKITDFVLLKELLKWYARLGLGQKILKCVKEKGECSFEAEL